jgi:hypothetical protein
LKILAIIVLLVVGGGFAFLLTWDIPPPSAPVEKVLPNDRFEK